MRHMFNELMLYIVGNTIYILTTDRCSLESVSGITKHTLHKGKNGEKN